MLQLTKRKYYTLLIIFSFLFAITNAQTYKVAIAHQQNSKLILNNVFSSAPIEGYNGDQIIINRVKKQSVGKSAKYIDNTGIGLHIEQIGNQITIHGLYNTGAPDLYQIKLPYHLMLDINRDIGFKEELYVRNMKSSVNINAVFSVKLHDIEGAVFVESKSGIIDVSFKHAGHQYPVSIIGFETDIYVRIPVDLGINSEVNCIGGGALYTDFGFNSSTPDNRKIGKPRKTTWEMNGGGAIFKITNYSGDVYFKKIK